ncbi:MAG: TetR/AcrR family transcriptional regulator [Acidimicrobiia bacterium]|nr:TetR/AcrR family transcriptional regulator [Acidimicrobiia bacterium]MBT8217436.1 TetR/AcrR family transcriptional regulator [Acidimicrobiia bacterium]NNF10251.1 TetR/AcrR family transcriptional regulator [Acidimicrobiia bacterium]NNL70797.1 TetR/AcrR family transcriptional regulator [Acidimicrobiia bacterium]
MPRINAATVDEHRASTRRALLEAAHDLFGRLGYSETTLGDLADHAGIGRTTFYDYFSGKDDLLAALVEESLPEVFERLVAGIPRSLSAREQVGALVVAMIEFVVTDPVFGLRLHTEVPGLTSEAQRRIGATHQGLIAEFGRIYQEGVAGGEFRDLPIDLAGHLMLDVVMSGARTVLGSPDPKQRFHDVADETARFLQNGLRR